MIDPKVYRRLWRSVNRSQAHKTPSKRNARWLIKPQTAPLWLPGVTLHQWEAAM